jgi:hypothetical protein
MARMQVLLSEVPEMVDELLRQALADCDIDLLPRGATDAELHHVAEGAPPPVVIVMSDQESATTFERELLLPHPQAVVLRLESDGRLLASRSVHVNRRVLSDTFTAADLVEAVEGAPTWRQRFE